MNGRPPAWRVWLAAVRPFAFPASFVPVFLGVATAAGEGIPVSGFLFAVTLLGVASFHAAANLLNDAADFGRGLDREVRPTSGAVVRGWITPRQAVRAALFLALAGFACGAFLTWKAGGVVAALGVAGAGLAFLYTRRGFCLKYAGLGDPVIFVAFSLLPLFGAYWVQAYAFSWQPLAWSLPAGALVVAILHANNWRDIGRDRAADCRTAAGWLGPAGSLWYYRLLVLFPYAAVALGLALPLLPGPRPEPPPSPWIALAFLSFPLAVKLAREAPDRLADLDAATARLHLSFGVLLGLGLFL